MSGLPRKKCTPKRASSNRLEYKTVQTRHHQNKPKKYKHGKQKQRNYSTPHLSFGPPPHRQNVIIVHCIVFHPLIIGHTSPYFGRIFAGLFFRKRKRKSLYHVERFTLHVTPTPIRTLRARIRPTHLSFSSSSFASFSRSRRMTS